MNYSIIGLLFHAPVPFSPLQSLVCEFLIILRCGFVARTVSFTEKRKQRNTKTASPVCCVYMDMFHIVVYNGKNTFYT